jgi:signal transduction histidine kinase
MKVGQKRLLNALALGALLATASYALEILLHRAGIDLASTVLDNLLIGALGGSLAFAWATLHAKRASEEFLAQVARREATWEERRRIAREIHDTLAQDLAGIIIQLEAAESTLEEDPQEARQHLSRARSRARESLAEARRSVWELRSQALEGGDLPSALERLLQRLTVEKMVKAEFSLEGSRRPLSPELEVSLLRIGQEALTNVINHAQASRVHVRLTYGPQEIGLLVEDDGRGFDPQVEHATRGFGLISLHERAARLEGRLTIDSQPGCGTRISALIPIRPASALRASK